MPSARTASARSRPPSRGWVALALVLLLAPGLAAAQVPTPPSAPLGEETQPDLVPLNPRANSTDERNPTTVCAQVMNIGEGASVRAFSVTMYVDEQNVGEQRVEQAMRGGSSLDKELCWDVRVPGGQHTLRVMVDTHNEVAETNEDNNARGPIRFFVRYTPQVDLVLTHFIVTPKTGKPDTSQFFVATVYNLGEEASPATVVDIRNDNGLLASLPLRELQPGQGARVVHPTSTNHQPMGAFVARAIVDPLDNVSERNETNNERIFGYEVLEHPSPDLYVHDVRADENLTTQRGVRITASVTNGGDRAALQVLVRLFNESGINLANASRQFLRPNETTQVQFHFLLPEGNHSLRVAVDPDERIIERDETNNDAWLNLTVARPPEEVRLPNLFLKEMILQPSDPRPGETVLVTAYLQNIGNNESQPFAVNFTVDGRFIGSSQVTSRLQPGNYMTLTQRWSPSAEGRHVVGALLDAANAVEEIDERDNLLTTPVDVRVPPPPPEPPAVPPNLTEPPEPMEPTPPTTPTDPAENATEEARVVLGDLAVGLRQVPGGVKGLIAVSLRNPTLAPVGRMTVTFKVGDEVLKEVLIEGLRAAAVTTARSGEVDLPAGQHQVTAELRIVGSTNPPQIAQTTYKQEAGPKETPAAGALATAGVIVAAAAVLSRWRRRP